MDRRGFILRWATAGAAVLATGGGARASAGSQVRRRVSTERAPRSLAPYSQGIIAGDTVYVAGQVPLDPATGRLVEGGFREQAVRALENVKAIVEAAGSSMDGVVKVNVYLSDLGNFGQMNEVYREFFREDYPVRTTIGAGLLPGMLIEVDCIAVRRAG